MLNKMHIKIGNIKAFPTVAISIILALVLVLFGIYVMIPADWLGVSVTASAYPNLIIRSVFGIITAAPAMPILYCNVRYDMKTLVETKLPKLRPYIFWMAVTYFYLTALRILYAGFFPPIWLVYLALGLISTTIWLTNRYY
jgi:hypothetical protein